MSNNKEERHDFVGIGKRIGELVQEKNAAYGNAFNESEKILRVLYPDGVSPDQYQDMLAMIRVIDKLFRIATDRDALGESPWNDITGYGILSVERIQYLKDSVSDFMKIEETLKSSKSFVAPIKDIDISNNID